MQEASLGERDSGKTFLIASWTKPVLSSQNKSMLNADSTKNYAQQKTGHVENCSVSHSESEIHAVQTATRNDIKS